MKYVAIDIETTGLDSAKDSIIEFAAVLDDLGEPKPLEELPVCRFLLHYDRLEVTPYCAALHHLLWKEMNDTPYENRLTWRDDHFGNCGVLCDPGILGDAFEEWLERNGMKTEAVVKGPSRVESAIYKINAGGKNFASFDMQFLKNGPQTEYGYGLENIEFRHRVIDPTSFFWDIHKDRESLPSTAACLERLRASSDFDPMRAIKIAERFYPPIQDRKYEHTALYDALISVALIRRAMGWKDVM